MKKLLQIGVSLAMVLGMIPSAMAATTKVIDSIKAPQTGESVSLKGQLVEDLGSSMYKFRDDTGEIKVSIPTWMISQEALAKNSQVEIVGTMVTSKSAAPQVNVGLLKVTQTVVDTVPAGPAAQQPAAPQEPVVK